MFTGIIEETGKIQSLSLAGTSGVLRVRAKKVLEGTRIGDSIAVNGVCLTVTSLSPDAFTADVMAETVRRTGLGSLKPGDRVNLERAMAADGRFGGHIVAEHIDGISLTVAYVDEQVFKVSVIPHTGEETTLLSKNPGDIVNLENDIVGKYIEKLMGYGIPGHLHGQQDRPRGNPDENTGSGLTLEYREQMGF